MKSLTQKAEAYAEEWAETQADGVGCVMNSDVENLHAYLAKAYTAGYAEAMKELEQIAREAWIHARLEKSRPVGGFNFYWQSQNKKGG